MVDEIHATFLHSCPVLQSSASVWSSCDDMISTEIQHMQLHTPMGCSCSKQVHQHKTQMPVAKQEMHTHAHRATFALLGIHIRNEYAHWEHNLALIDGCVLIEGSVCFPTGPLLLCLQALCWTLHASSRSTTSAAP